MNPRTLETIQEHSAQSWDELLRQLDYYRGPNKDRELEIQRPMPESAEKHFASIETQLFGGPDLFSKKRPD